MLHTPDVYELYKTVQSLKIVGESFVFLMSRMRCPHEKLWDTVTILNRLIIEKD